MGVFRIAAAIGVLYLVAPQVPRSAFEKLAAWSGALAPTAGDAGSLAVRYCSDHPDECAKLLRSAMTARGALGETGAQLLRTTIDPEPPKPKARHGDHARTRDKIGLRS